MNEYKSNIFYLDDNNNYVDKENATHAIIREVDSSNNLINETFMYIDNKKDVKKEHNLSNEDLEFIKSFGLNADINNLNIKKEENNE